MGPDSTLPPPALGRRAAAPKGEKIKLVADDKIRRVVLCSGKVYYDLYEEREKRGIDDIYLLRVEQLYPFPLKALVTSCRASRRPRWSGARKSRATWAPGPSSSPISNGCWSRPAPSSARALCRPPGFGRDRDRADVQASGAAESVPRRGARLTARERLYVPERADREKDDGDRNPGSDTGRIRNRSDHRPLVQEGGDAVAADEPLVELETDKVTVEVPAPAAGVLEEIRVKDGETVGVGALLGSIKEGAGGAKAAPAKASQEPASRTAETDQGRRRPRAGRAAFEGEPPRRRPASCAVGAQARAESGVTPRTSGHRQGRPRDQGRHAGRRSQAARSPRRPAQARAPSPADDAAREERVRMTRLRQTIATPPQGSAEHGRHAHDLQRGRHERGDA
jgi:hypothetical protein